MERPDAPYGRVDLPKFILGEKRDPWIPLARARA
jgi:hypothetical protein